MEIHELPQDKRRYAKLSRQTGHMYDKDLHISTQDYIDQINNVQTQVYYVCLLYIHA